MNGDEIKKLLDVLKAFYPHFEPKKPILGKHLIGLPVQIIDGYSVGGFGLRSDIGIIEKVNQKDKTITANFVTNATMKVGNKYLNIVKSLTLTLNDCKILYGGV